MSSRSRSDLFVLLFGAIAEGVWSGALAAALTGGAGWPFIAFATTVILAAALIVNAGGSGKAADARIRGSAVALTVAAAAVLLVAVDSGGGPTLFLLVPDVGYSALLVLLGASLATTQSESRKAARRMARTFALLCLVVIGAAMASSPPSWAIAALALTLVAGGLHAAAARSASLESGGPAPDGAPASSWLLAVLGVTLAVVAAGFLLSQLLQTDVLRWMFATVGDVLRYVLEVVGYVIAVVGAAVIRAIAWVAGLFHVHAHQIPQPETPTQPTIRPHPEEAHGATSSLTRLLVLGALLVAAISVPLALVALALRRFRRTAPEEVAEEREAVQSLWSAAGEGLARWSRKVRRLMSRPEAPRTPAELIRRRYAELERRLFRAGHVRPPGATVRAYLADLAAAGPPSDAPLPAGAVYLATLYEVARYSDGDVDAAAAYDFERAALAFGGAVTAVG